MTILAQTKPLRNVSLRSPLPKKDECDDDGYMMSDGKPMAESREHMDAMIYAIFALRTHLKSRPDAYVTGNDFVHYREGSRTSYLSPDCYVVFGVDPNKSRDNFKTWVENASPSVIIEFTPTKTRRTDTGKKRLIYEEVMKVQEYYLFDPKNDYLKPRLQGMELVDGHYRNFTLDENERLYSPTLDLLLGFEGKKFRCYSPHTGLPFLSPEEEQERANRAEFRANREQTRAREAERRLEIEREVSASERQRAEFAEAEMAKLKAELAALRPSE